MVGNDDEMFMTRSFNVRPKTTEQHLIAHSDKSVACVTIKDSALRFVLLKLTTDIHESIVQPLCDSRATCCKHLAVFVANFFMLYCAKLK